MKLDLSRYEGDSLDVAVDVFYAMIDDLTVLIERPGGVLALTLQQLREYRRQAVRQAYSAWSREPEGRGVR